MAGEPPFPFDPSMFFFPPQKFYQPATDNPTQFPRSTPIEDEDSLMHLSATNRLMERYQELQREQRRLQDQMDVLQVDLQGHKVRLFQRLKALFPAITGGYGYGWRLWQDHYYVVGWDEPSPTQNSE